MVWGVLCLRVLYSPWRKFTGGIYQRADEARVSHKPDFCTAASVAPWHQKAKTAAVWGGKGGLGVQRGFSGEKKEKRGKGFSQGHNGRVVIGYRFLSGPQLLFSSNRIVLSCHR